MYGFNEDKSRSSNDVLTYETVIPGVSPPGESSYTINGSIPYDIKQQGGKIIAISLYGTKTGETLPSQLAYVPYRVFEDGINGSGTFKNGMSIGYREATIKGILDSYGAVKLHLHFPYGTGLGTSGGAAPTWVFEYTI